MERLQALPRERRADLRRERHQGHRAHGDGGRPRRTRRREGHGHEGGRARRLRAARAHVRAHGEAAPRGVRLRERDGHLRGGRVQGLAAHVRRPLRGVRRRVPEPRREPAQDGDAQGPPGARARESRQVRVRRGVRRRRGPCGLHRREGRRDPDGLHHGARERGPAPDQPRRRLLLRPPVLEGRGGDDRRRGRQADDVPRGPQLHQGADARERRDLRGRALGPLLLQGELHGRVELNGHVRAREHRLEERQAPERAHRAAPPLFAVGRDQLARGGRSRRGPGAREGHVCAHGGARVRAGRRERGQLVPTPFISVVIIIVSHH